MYKFYDKDGTTSLTYTNKPPQRVFDHYEGRYIELKSEPIFEEKEGFIKIEYVDLETKELKCRYKEIPPQPVTLEDEVKTLKQENEVLGQLVSQGEIERLEMGQAISNLELEILNLKGGTINA